MSNQKDIRDAIAEAFIAENAQNDALTEWENVEFDPAGKAVWYRFFFFPNVPRVAELGSAGSDANEGFVQIDVSVPLGGGDKVARERADAIRSAFTAGARLIKNNVNVIVTSCGQSAGRQVGNFYRVSLSIYWETRLRR